jgi:hypothetical protein
LIGVQFYPVPISSGGHILIVEVARSWNIPHRVTVNSKFYMRHSRSNEEMSVDEIRRAVLAASGQAERLQQWREKRVLQLESDLVGQPRDGKAGTLALHILPLQNEEGKLDASKPQKFLEKFYILDHLGYGVEPNFLGLGRRLLLDSNKYLRGSFQIYRNGYVEAILTGIFRINPDSSGRKILPANKIPDLLTSTIPNYISGILDAGFSSPHALFLSLLGAQNTCLGCSFDDISDPIIDINALLFDPILIETPLIKDEWHRILKPIFDQLWQSYGYAEYNAPRFR